MAIQRNARHGYWLGKGALLLPSIGHFKTEESTGDRPTSGRCAGGELRDEEVEAEVESDLQPTRHNTSAIAPLRTAIDTEKIVKTAAVPISHTQKRARVIRGKFSIRLA